MSLVDLSDSERVSCRFFSTERERERRETALMAVRLPFRRGGYILHFWQVSAVKREPTRVNEAESKDTMMSAYGDSPWISIRRSSARSIEFDSKRARDRVVS